MATQYNQIQRSEFSSADVVAQYFYDGLGNTTFTKYAYVSAPCFEVEFRYAPKSSAYSHSATASIYYYNYTDSSWILAKTFNFTSDKYNSTIQYGSFRHNCNRPSDWSTADKTFTSNSKLHLWRIVYTGDVGSRAESWMRIFIRGLNSSLVPSNIYNTYFKGSQIACCKSSTSNDFAYVRSSDTEQSSALAQFKRTNFRGNYITATQVNSLISI